jgi:predicted 3-demethylubiquinone-9 3-methyltransferase (glyoxalase superfamily)
MRQFHASYPWRLPGNRFNTTHAQAGKQEYGLSWQVVPTVLGTMLQDKDAQKSARVMKAMMQMGKLDIGILKQAYGPQ